MAKDLSAIAPVIPIDRLDTLPLHRQICEGFRAAILRGNLQPGQQVPSSRHLAEDLEVSRCPVLGAYARLLSEGYFESRVGSGTFVSTSLPGQLPHGRRSRSTTGGSRCLSRRSSLLPRCETVPWRHGGDPSESTSRRSISFPSERGRSCWLNTVEDHVCAPFITTTRWGLIASETQSALTSAPRGLSNATRRKS